MINEFHTVDAQCATLKAQGTRPSPSLVKCVTTVGSNSGSSTVSDLKYLELAYNYSYSHLRQVRL